jgi:hypothetical protein
MGDVAEWVCLCLTFAYTTYPVQYYVSLLRNQPMAFGNPPSSSGMPNVTELRSCR